MSVTNLRPILLATAFTLAGCGGGGGYGIASTPPPPVTPTPTPTPGPAIASTMIIPGATTSQQFAVTGSSHPYAPGETPQFGSGNQLQVRYVQSSNSYEVQLPQSQTWRGIALLETGSSIPQRPINYGGGGVGLWLDTNYAYSGVFEWSGGNALHGYEAIGVATPVSGVPVTGTADFHGAILGFTSEDFGGDSYNVRGSITLSFDFGLGSLSGSVSPETFFGLTPIAFRDTVYSSGSTTFSGKFDTSLPGLNSFSGLFTGPKAQELIGNFAFPYQSPGDGKVYQADGAFVAKDNQAFRR
jgi:hypothetical protein